MLQRTISLDVRYFAGGVPNSKNGGILRFREIPFMNRPFINPKVWYFSPYFRIGDFDRAKRGQTGAKC